MKVYKFGGASVNDIERIRKVGMIVKETSNEKMLIVISAMGKTTNALEKVAEAFYNNRSEEAMSLFLTIKEQHLATAKQLLVHTYNETYEHLSGFFTEIEWLLHDRPVQEFDYYYDQIVCIGELLSTAIMSAFFNEQGIANNWIDVRDILRTDDQFRDASIDWAYSLQAIQSNIVPLFDECNIVVTQGYIAATDENESTTLGREGSDYTAAVFANMLDAESLTIWKDVEGVMNADPKEFPDATLIKELNYREVIEMAYYGAQVIHPKTIKPLQNKNIPMYVKCFLDSSLPGTFIHNNKFSEIPPVIVVKRKQVLIEVTSLDFSFIGSQALTNIYQALDKLHLTPNLSQKGAINFKCVLDDHEEKIGKLAEALATGFDVQIIKQLTLITLRHYNEPLASKILTGRVTVLQQQTPQTIQAVVSDLKPV